MEHDKILEWIFSHKWAMYKPALSAMIGIVERVLNDPVAIAQAFHGKNMDNYLDEDNKPKQALLPSTNLSRMDNTYSVRVKDSVAIIPVTGVIFPRYSSVPMSFGAHTVIDRLSHDFNVAINNDEIKSIIMVYDSPGGEVTGVSDMSKMIFKGNAKKTVLSFVYGMSASAGYFLASAGSEIVGSDTSEVGSIGVVAEYIDTTEAEEKKGIKRIEIVSNLSPNKRPDLKSDSGRAQIQKIIDDLATIFVSSVAKYRGIKFEDVLSKYGQGKMIVANEALEIGMIDRISTLENILDEQIKNNESIHKSIGGAFMNAIEVKEKHPDTHKKIFEDGKIEGMVEGENEGITKENERLKAIEAIKAPGFEDIIAEHKFNPKMTVEKISAIILEAQEAKREKQAKAHVADAENLGKDAENISQNTGSDKKAEEDEAVKNMVAGANPE